MSRVVSAARPLLHVVLHEPEIPQNTGNIGRTCMATGCGLHLIKPLGFDTSEKACRRAGLDYWARLNPVEHESWWAYLSSSGVNARAGGPRLWLVTNKGPTKPIWSATIAPGDHLAFGKETVGFPDELHERHAESLLMLPMMPGERSLNLATVVCAAVYEGLRQMVNRGEIRVDGENRIVV